MRLGALLPALLASAAMWALGCSGAPVAGPAVVDVWGSGGSGSGELTRPTGIAVSRDGTVFVADTGNDRIQAFSSSGAFLWTFGSSGEGPGEFQRPMDIDIDEEGLLYVSGLGGDRVQVFTAKGALLRELRGDRTPAGSFDGAAGVLVAPSGDVYVADFYNHRVVRFGPEGNFRKVIGVPGRALPGRLHYPTDLDWVDGRLVVADAYNNRIQLFTPEGEPVLRFGGLWGSGLPGSRPGSFRIATGVATDAAGHIYVADFENDRIQVFDAEGELLSVFGSQGNGPGEFERPTDLDVGPNGRIFVVDFGNDRIQVFEPFSAAG